MGKHESPRTAKDPPIPTVFPSTRVAPGEAAPVDPDDAGHGHGTYERPGGVDFRWLDETRSQPDLLRSDATCAIAWRVDGYEAILLFVDPVLRDRAGELCAAIEGWSGVHRDLDDLSAEITRYADHERLSVSIYPRPRDGLSKGVVAIAVTLG